MPNYTPQLKRRTALQRKLKDVFRHRHQSQPVDQVVQLIDPILRGWVNYFAVGHSSECFSFIKDWWKRRLGATCSRARETQGLVQPLPTPSRPTEALSQTATAKSK